MSIDRPIDTFPDAVQKGVCFGKMAASKEARKSGKRTGMRRFEDQMTRGVYQRLFTARIRPPKQKNHRLFPIRKKSSCSSPNRARRFTCAKIPITSMKPMSFPSCSPALRTIAIAAKNPRSRRNNPRRGIDPIATQVTLGDLFYSRTFA